MVRLSNFEMREDVLPEDLLQFFVDAQASGELIKVRVPQEYGGIVRGRVSTINSGAGQICLRTSTNPNHPIPLDLVKSAKVVNLEPKKNENK